MPLMPPHRCGTCGNLVTGRCARCAQQHDRRRGSRHTRGYDRTWTYWRAQTITRYFLMFCGDRPPRAPLTADSVCLQQGLKTVGSDLDHIERIADRFDPRRLDETNVQLLCVTCHAKKRSRESLEPGGVAS